MTVDNKVSLDIEYTGTDFTRRYTMSGVSSSQLPSIESACEAINASLLAGTAGGMSSIFISDDFDPSQGIGYMQKIYRAQIVSSEVVPIEF